MKHIKSMVACGIIQVIDISDTVAGRKYEPEYMNANHLIIHQEDNY